jgi:F-type H+-transporting ATPase subunit gamma
MTQKPVIEQLVPIKATEKTNIAKEYLYEPEPKALIDHLVTRYIEAEVYQAMVENIASEQAARMLAMKNATDNAKDIIDEFKLIYNKTRQAKITTELSEIVSGKEAL